MEVLFLLLLLLGSGFLTLSISSTVMVIIRVDFESIVSAELLVPIGGLLQVESGGGCGAPGRTGGDTPRAGGGQDSDLFSAA